MTTDDAPFHIHSWRHDWRSDRRLSALQGGGLAGWEGIAWTCGNLWPAFPAWRWQGPGFSGGAGTGETGGKGRP